MNYLLDTHIFLWWLSDPKKLSLEVIEIIENPNKTIYISAVVIWEISIKRALKKITVTNSFVDAVEECHFTHLPFNHHHANFAGILPKKHVDPFDRLLIAQASLENLCIITSDEMIRKYDINILIN